ncbi:hypothetical protein VB005_06129 [Metarhizium brunneum]
MPFEESEDANLGNSPRVHRIFSTLLAANYSQNLCARLNGNRNLTEISPGREDSVIGKPRLLRTGGEKKSLLRVSSLIRKAQRRDVYNDPKFSATFSAYYRQALQNL